MQRPAGPVILPPEGFWEGESMDAVRKLAVLGLGLLDMTEEKARELADDLVKRGEARGDQAGKLVKEIMVRGEEVKKSVQGFVPNTGYAAIWAIAKGNCKSLYVSGFNFMRNPYRIGYHDHLTDHQQAIRLIEKYGNHNPDKDLESFRELIKAHPIQCDDTLTDILSRPTERLFYQQCPAGG